MVLYHRHDQQTKGRLISTSALHADIDGRRTHRSHSCFSEKMGNIMLRMMGLISRLLCMSMP